MVLLVFHKSCPFCPVRPVTKVNRTGRTNLSGQTGRNRTKPDVNRTRNRTKSDFSQGTKNALFEDFHYFGARGVGSLTGFLSAVVVSDGGWWRDINGCKN